MPFSLRARFFAVFLLFLPLIAMAQPPMVGLATRGFVGTGDQAMIGGLVLQGSGTKRVLFAVKGPSLSAAGITTPLANPRLEIPQITSQAVNDDWASDASADELRRLNRMPSDPLEAAMIRTLSAGAYTPIVTGVGGGTGVALLEIYDLSPEVNTLRIKGLATRGFVGEGERQLIGGVIVSGSGLSTLLFTAKGPSMAAVGLNGLLADPQLWLPQLGNARNDNWRQSPNAAQIIELGQSPSHEAEAALLLDVAAGAFTPVISGASGGASGIGLVEMYEMAALPPPEMARGWIYEQYLGNWRQIPDFSTITPFNAGTTEQINLDMRVQNDLFGLKFRGWLDIETAGPVVLALRSDDGGRVKINGEIVVDRDGIRSASTTKATREFTAGRHEIVIEYFEYYGKETLEFWLETPQGTRIEPVVYRDNYTPPPPPAPLPNATTVRFLQQATFGATPESVARFEALGMEGWINEQLSLPYSSHLDYLNGARMRGDIYQNQRMEAFWQHAITAPDQLRQRLALAWSELFVVSDVDGNLENYPEALAHYYDHLGRGSTGNYRDLLETVTLSPVMGLYLSHLGNAKPNPETGSQPDENYAREVMQLFSIGLWELNPDGTRKLANNQPIPTYDLDTVIGFAHVFTGWTYNWANRWPGSRSRENMMQPMELWPNYHSTAAKKLLSGVSLPPNQSGAVDLSMALDNLFQHPNVGPFLAYRLIQRITTSNPSPAYVGRVAAVFNNNGQGVRGDLTAVTKAILLDIEARRGEKMKEPLIALAQFFRLLKVSPHQTYFSYWNPEKDLGQAPLRSPSVFNFFLPDYIPADLASQRLAAPELQILTNTTVVSIHNEFYDRIFKAYPGYGYPGRGTFWLNFDDLWPLSTQPAQLVDYLDIWLTGGRMTSQLKAELVPFLTTLPIMDRILNALYFTTTAPDFWVER